LEYQAKALFQLSTFSLQTVLLQPGFSAETMKEPALPIDQFHRDRIVRRERLIHTNSSSGSPKLNKKSLHSNSSSGILCIPLACPAPDLSRFNQISFTAVNMTHRPICAEVKMVHGSGKAEIIGTPISLSGGREMLPPGRPTELKFPTEAFGTYGNPTGWKDIKSIDILFKPEKTDTSCDAIIVKMGSLFGENRIIPKGPRLTSAGLSAVLKKEGPIPAEQSDPYGAQHLHGFDIPAPHAFPKESADEILQGQIMGKRLSSPIPWQVSPSGILEWTHFLNRHHFLRNVIQALAETGDSRYAGYLAETVSDWIASNPVPVMSNGGAGPSWETLSAAWRLWEWLRIKAIAWPCPAFGDSTRERMLRSFWEHARHLMDHIGHPNNWIIVESAALALAGMCLPVFLESQVWVEEGIRRLQNEFIRQFMDDGAQYEFSPLYQAICLHAYLDVKRVAALQNIALPDVFDAPLEKAAAYLCALCRPDFTWPAFNDSGSIAGDHTGLMRLAGEIFDRKDFIWIGARGSHGIPPDGTLKVFPDAGIGIMRSGYDAHAHYLAFRAGSAGMTHVHDDALSIEVAAHGIPCLVDPGITGYAPGPLTDYYRSTAAHNSLLLDGRGPLRSQLSFLERTQSSRDKLVCFSQGDVMGLAGTCRDYRDASGEIIPITRMILFIARRFWAIQDTAMGTGVHTLTTCWQFTPGNVEMDRRSSIIRSTNHLGTGIAIIPCTADHQLEILSHKGKIDPPCGWVSIDGADIAACHSRFSVCTKLPITLTWVLYPVSEQDNGFGDIPDIASNAADLFRKLQITPLNYKLF
jgi:hypothetical protein